MTTKDSLWTDGSPQPPPQQLSSKGAAILPGPTSAIPEVLLLPGFRQLDKFLPLTGPGIGTYYEKCHLYAKHQCWHPWDSFAAHEGAYVESYLCPPLGFSHSQAHGIDSDKTKSFLTLLPC